MLGSSTYLSANQCISPVPVPSTFLRAIKAETSRPRRALNEISSWHHHIIVLSDSTNFSIVTTTYTAAIQSTTAA